MNRRESDRPLRVYRRHQIRRDVRNSGGESNGQVLNRISNGKLDAFLCQETAGQQAIDEGLALRGIEPAAYTAFPAGALDRASGLAVMPFLDEINNILGARLQDGTLGGLSTTYFGRDYASPTVNFDLESIGQTIP